MDLHIVLVNPEIPQNSGNIARTCAALGARLHLVEPLGFSLDDRYLKRAGLDYWELVSVVTHPSLDNALSGADSSEIFFMSAHGTVTHVTPRYPDTCWMVFGPESTGLPKDLLLHNSGHVIRIPMQDGARSLNLSNAVAILAYEAFRQHNFAGLICDRLAQPTGGNED